MRITWALRVALIASLAIVGASSIASAQTEKKFGFVIGFPATAGVQWQLNERVTIRGDAGFDWGKVDQVDSSVSAGIVGGPPATTSSTFNFRHSSASAGVATLITVSRHDQLRLYVAPRIGWHVLHSSSSTTTVTVRSGGLSTTLPARSSSSTTNGLEIDGMFGGNYRLSDRFSVFGEAGISYVSPTSTSSSADETTSYSVGSRSHVGIVIHF